MSLLALFACILYVIVITKQILTFIDFINNYNVIILGLNAIDRSEPQDCCKTLNAEYEVFRI